MDTVDRLEGMVCIELRPLSSRCPKGGLRPDYTRDPRHWFIYPRVPERYGVLLEPNGLLVIDVDRAEMIGALGLPETFTVRTGGGGYHLYYRHSGLGSDHRPFWGEIKARGHVVGPGVLHESGRNYTVCRNMDISEMTPDILGPLRPRRERVVPPSPHARYPGSRALDFIFDPHSRARIASVLYGRDPAHHSRLWMVYWLHKVTGLSGNEVLSLIERECRWLDYDRHYTRAQVRSVVGV